MQAIGRSKFGLIARLRRTFHRFRVLPDASSPLRAAILLRDSFTVIGRMPMSFPFTLRSNGLHLWDQEGWRTQILVFLRNFVSNHSHHGHWGISEFDTKACLRPSSPPPPGYQRRFENHFLYNRPRFVSPRLSSCTPKWHILSTLFLCILRSQNYLFHRGACRVEAAPAQACAETASKLTVLL